MTINFKTINLALISALGGFLFGYDTGVVSGAMIQLRKNFALSYVLEEWIVSITILCAAIFSIVGGLLCDRIGRKPIIMIASLIFTIGSIILGLAQQSMVLLFGRAIVGIAIGLSSMAIPMYIAESSPFNVRSRMITINTVFITGGQFVASIIDGLFYPDQENGWRYMLGLAAIPGILQFIGFFFLDESPRWLVLHGKIDKARKVIEQIYNESEEVANTELNKIVQSVKNANESGGVYEQMVDDSDGANNVSKNNHSSYNTYKRIFSDPVTRKALFVGCSLQLFQQLGGINTVMYYGASILSMAGLNQNNEDESYIVWLASFVASFNFVFSLIGIYLVGKFRRRTLLLISFTLIIFSLIILGTGFAIIARTTPPVTVVEPAPIGKDFPTASVCLSAKTCDECITRTQCGFCFSYDASGNNAINGSCVLSLHEFSTHSAYGRCEAPKSEPNMKKTNLFTYDNCPTDHGWIILVGLVSYLIAFAPAMCHLPWIINAEIYPNWARGVGNSFAVACNWGANLLVSVTFLSLTRLLTRPGVFFMYGIIMVFGFIFSAVFVPETSDVSLEETEVVFGH